MAKKCVVNKNDNGNITTVMVPNPVNIQNISSKIAQKYNVLLNKMGFLLNNNSVEAVKKYGDLSEIAKITGMTIAVTQNKNYKIYTDLLTNTIYINQDTQINQSDIDSMLSELYRKYGTKDINKIGKEIIKKRDKLVFKESKEAVFSNLNRSKTVEEIFNSYIDGADYVEVTSDKGDVRIFYDNNDQYPERDIAEMIGDTFEVKTVTMGAKTGATNFHKIGDVQITQKVKHSLTAYNGRTINQILNYWNEVWSNNKVLTESASTRTEKFGSDVYIELSDETPYMGVSPYDNYSLSKESENPVLQNVKYITRSIIDTDPVAVKEAVENARDYEEWLVNVSPANVERIVFKNLEEAQIEGRILNNRWGIEVASEDKSNKVGTYKIEGIPELRIEYIYGVAYNLYDSEGNEYTLTRDFRELDPAYIFNDSGSVRKELTRDEYLKIKSDIADKIDKYLKQKDELKIVFPRKIVQNVMFQNETSGQNSEETPQEILKGVTDILLEKGLVDNIEILDLESLEKLKLENPDFKSVGEFNGAYDSKTKKVYIIKNDIQIYLHEFSHPFLQWMRDNKPAHYQAGVKLLSSNSTEAQPYIDMVRRTQPGLKEGSQEFYEEVLAEIVGSNGGLLVNSTKSNSIREWLENFWKLLQDIVGITQYTPTEISQMKLSEFSRAVNAEMLDRKAVQNSSLSLAALEQPLFKIMRGTRISPQAIRNGMKGKGIKKIESDIANSVLDMPEFQTKKIDYDTFELAVKTQLMPLTPIKSDTYADYGSQQIDGDYDKTETIIYNSPLNHSVTEHFEPDYNPQTLDQLEYPTKPTIEDFKYIDEDSGETVISIPGQGQFPIESVTEQEIQEKLENFYQSQIKRYNELLITLPISQPNQGLFGHTRVWTKDNIYNVAEVQSDVFQKEDLTRNFINDNYTVDLDIEVSKKLNEREQLFVERINELLKPYDLKTNDIVVSETHSVENKLQTELNRKLQKLNLKIDEVRNNRDYDILNDEKERLRLEYGKTLKDFKDKVQKIKNEWLEDRDVYRDKFKEEWLSIFQKQFLASEKFFELRLIRESIQDAANRGFEKLRLPLPYTLSKIEGYIKNKKIAQTDDYTLGATTLFLDELYYITEIDDDLTGQVTPADNIAMFPKDNLDANKYKKEIDDNDKSVRNIMETNSSTNFIEIVNKIKEADLKEPTYKEYFESNNIVYFIKNPDIFENVSFKEYNVDATSFKIEELPIKYQTIARRYEEFGQMLEKERGSDNYRIIEDKNGYPWYETDIKPEDKVNPVLAFQLEDYKQYLTESDFDSNGNIKPEVLVKIESEKQSIISRTKADGTFMKAPNGNKTNLTEDQWIDVRTERFKNWFGNWNVDLTENEKNDLNTKIEKLKDQQSTIRNNKEYNEIEEEIQNLLSKVYGGNHSKAIDENGEPKVFYHGSDYDQITEFDQSKGNVMSGLKEFAYYFTTNLELAKLYQMKSLKNRNALDEKIQKLYDKYLNTKNVGESRTLGEKIKRLEYISETKGRVYPVFLNIRNPMETYGTGLDEREWSKLELNIGYKYAKGKGDVMEALSGNNSMYKNENIDGVKMNNIADMVYGNSDENKTREGVSKFVGDVIALWNPNQIKSAESNQGTYSSENNNINFQVEAQQTKMIPSVLFEQLRQQPFVTSEQALEAYKNIYTDAVGDWQSSELENC